MGISKGRVLKTGVQGKASEGLAIEVQMGVKSSVQSVQLGVKGSVQCKSSQVFKVFKVELREVFNWESSQVFKVGY